MNSSDPIHLSAIAPETIVIDDLVGVALLDTADAGSKIRWANPAFAALLGRTPDGIAGRPLDQLLDDPDLSAAITDLPRAPERTVRIAAPSGSVLLQLSPTDRPGQVVVVVSPAHRTPRAAMYDAVTGLASLALFREHLQLGLNRHARDGDELAVITVGAPGFAVAWQQHTGAASVLQTRMGERIEQVVRDSDVLAARRPGSFLLLVIDATDAVAAATLVSERLIDAFGMPLVVDDALQPLDVAIGIGGAAAGDEPDGVIARADAAYARAAADGRNRYRIEQDAR